MSEHRSERTEQPAEQSSELPIDDRIDNAETEWRSLPWHKRLWEWLRP